MESLFNHLNTYYWNSIQERQDLSDLIDSDTWIDGLIHFCNYAFERAGSPSIYRESAKEAFEQCREWLDVRERWSIAPERKIYEVFIQACNKNKLEKYNLKNNPMGPSNGGQLSMIRFAWYETENSSIAGWAATCIKNDDLLNAFEKLKKIRGVGNKIASFYLRDIYILLGNANKTLRNSHLIQPIDTWTRRASRLLLNDKDASDEKCAAFLIEYENKIGIINGSLNIAIWVLGSQIAEDEKTFNEYIYDIKRKDSNSLKNRLADKIEEEREWLNFLETIHSGI